MGKKILIYLILTLFFFMAGKSALAISTPSFPACTFPTGVHKVHYDEGTHGIPGDMSEHLGTDDVYEVNDQILYQCFCTPDGNGIQTNWWKVSSLSQTDIDYLKRLGWVYIPDGSLWGLSSDPYMALSNAYDCSGAGIGVGGAVLGAWAPTGNKPLIYLFAGSGLLSLALSLRLKKRSSHGF